MSPWDTFWPSDTVFALRQESKRGKLSLEHKQSIWCNTWITLWRREFCSCLRGNGVMICGREGWQWAQGCLCVWCLCRWSEGNHTPTTDMWNWCVMIYMLLSADQQQSYQSLSRKDIYNIYLLLYILCYYYIYYLIYLYEYIIAAL